MFSKIIAISSLMTYAVAQTLPNCPDSKVVIAIDKSRSIDETEMNAQKSLLTTVVSKLDINEDKISLDLMKFSRNAVEIQYDLEDNEEAEDVVEEFVDMDFDNRTSKITDFGRVFEEADELFDDESGNLVIVTDGTPERKSTTKKAYKKYLKRACEAREAFTAENPDVKITCIQSGNARKRGGNLFSCGCDETFFTGGRVAPSQADIDLWANAMAEDICRLPDVKKPDPCSAHGDNKRVCLGVRADRRTGELGKQHRNKVCKHSKKRKACYVLKDMKQWFSDEGDDITMTPTPEPTQSPTLPTPSPSMAPSMAPVESITTLSPTTSGTIPQQSVP